MDAKKLCKKISDTAVRVGPVRFSYPQLFEPKQGDDGKDFYQVCCIVDADNTLALNLINEAIENAKAQGKSNKWDGKVPPTLKSPLRDGNDKEDPAFQDKYFFNCKTYNKPGVAVKEGGIVSPIFDKEDFYAGCYGAVTVNFYPYNSHGSKGIGAGLQNVIKTEDGERLSGSGVSLDADFGDLED